MSLAVLPLAACKGSMRFTCTDTKGLTQAEIDVRSNLGYVDVSQSKEKHCEDCVQWIPPKDEGCGGCKIMKGPVHPRGTCRVFAAKS